MSQARFDRELRRWRVVGEAVLPRGPYTELADVARALEVEYGGAPELTVKINSTWVTLALDLSSGTVTGLVVNVALEGTGRPNPSGVNPFLELRAEREADRSGKERGINREVQTGDTSFDKAVYIDSDASDAEVGRVLAKARSRQAVLTLLDSSCTSLRIDRASLTVKWATSRTPYLFKREHLARALHALLDLVAAGGPRVAGAARRGRWLAGLSAAALCFSLPYLLVILRSWEIGWQLPVTGLVFGPALATASQPLLARLVAGDSGSFHRLAVTFWSLLFALAFLGAAVPVHLNAALDTAAPTVVRGEVTGVCCWDSESDTWDVTVAWSDGERQELSLHDKLEPGASLTKRRYPGAFGYPWAARDF